MTDDLRQIAAAARAIMGFPSRSRRQVKKLLRRSHPHENYPITEAFVAPRRRATERMTGVYRARGAANG